MQETPVCKVHILYRIYIKENSVREDAVFIKYKSCAYKPNSVFLAKRQSFIWDRSYLRPQAALRKLTLAARPCIGVRILPFHPHVSI